MQETRIQSLDWEDPLEQEMATRSSILAWRIPGTGEPGRLQSAGSQSQTQLKQFSMHSLASLQEEAEGSHEASHRSENSNIIKQPIDIPCKLQQISMRTKAETEGISYNPM